MKKAMKVMLTGIFVVASAGMLWAATTFTVRAVVPTATSVNITASTVPAAGGTFTPVSGTTLAFGTMYFDNVIPSGETVAPNIWRAPNYFAIDVANAGAGSPNVTLVYAEGSKPATQVHGLGWKTIADFKKVTGAGTKTTDATIAGHSAKALKDVTSEHILPTDLIGGWLRVYVGIADGATGAPGEPFTNADQPGTYTGTLTVSATVS